MAAEQALVAFNRLLDQNHQALTVFEGQVTRDKVVMRGRGLGLLMGVVDSKTMAEYMNQRVRSLTDLMAGAINYERVKSEPMLSVFCGGVEVDGAGFIGQASVEQGFNISAGNKIYIRAGVDSIPPYNGISRHWFEVYAQSKEQEDKKKITGVEVRSDGRVYFTKGNDRPIDVSRLNNRSNGSILQAMAAEGIHPGVLILAQDIRWIGSLINGFVQHTLGNPYREWSVGDVWKSLTTVKYDEWKFVCK